jgi:cell division protein FtsL
VTPPAAAAAPSVRRPSRGAAPGPRRVSGPARKAGVPAGRRARAQSPGLVPGVLDAVRRLERHRLLDRLIAGRAWIALVAFALIGIVTLQLGLLELNANVGRALEREASLQRQNTALAIENSELAAGGRVESLASRLGMELVPMSALRFLKAHPATDAVRAAATLSAPAKSSAATGEGAAGAGAGAAAQAGAPDAEQASAQSSGEPADAQAASTPAGAAQPGSGEAGNAVVPAAGATQAGSSGGEAGGVTGAQGTAAPPSTTSSSPSASGGSAEASPGGGTQAGATG